MAIHKREDGIVLIDGDLCMGCRYCEWTCPYGALQYNEQTGRMTKCNLCYDYIDDGKIPSCVASCPMRVLDFGPLDELIGKYGKGATVFPLVPDEICDPSLVVKKHRKCPSLEKDSEITNWEEVKND
jgi:anaerobic dimethyl sulfoxide reductase subunit B (iron-sulfur subunit)